MAQLRREGADWSLELVMLKYITLKLYKSISIHVIGIG